MQSSAEPRIESRHSSSAEKAGAGRTVVNALSFDIEDYFQVSNFEQAVAKDSWTSWPSRVERNVDIIMRLLAERGIRATCFILGWVAKHHPEVVKQISENGHEIACHGWDHTLVYTQSREVFRRDTREAVSRIEDLAGARVLGYRAASFSITRQSLWAIDVLGELGFAYDSSVFPIRHPRYGIPDAPRGPYEIVPGFWEFPMTTLSLARGFNLPVGGGGYFRLYPYLFTRWALKRVNTSGIPAIVYLHPWEFDPGQPRINASILARFRHYVSLAKTARRLRRMCGDFRFAPIKEVLGL